MIFIITAEIAGGNATIADAKWEVARTTPKEEFCIPTCVNSVKQVTCFHQILTMHAFPTFFNQIYIHRNSNVLIVTKNLFPAINLKSVVTDNLF